MDARGTWRVCLMSQAAPPALLAALGCMDQSLRNPEVGLSVCAYDTRDLR